MLGSARRRLLAIVAAILGGVGVAINGSDSVR